jgi:hypothetical protein
MSRLAQVEQALLAQPAADPPVYEDLAERLGWQEMNARIERWAANGYAGQLGDSEYDDGFDGGDDRG